MCSRSSGVEGIVDCRDVKGLLGAFMDGELEPAVSASVRDHLTTCAACGNQLKALESVGRMIRRAPYHQAPDALRARLTQTRRPSIGSSPLLAWAAAVVLIASLTGAIVLIRSSTRTRPDVAPVDTVAQEI